MMKFFALFLWFLLVFIIPDVLLYPYGSESGKSANKNSHINVEDHGIKQPPNTDPNADNPPKSASNEENTEPPNQNLPHNINTNEEGQPVQDLNLINKGNSLSEICIREVCHEDKRADDLTPMEMGKVLGKMDEKYALQAYLLKKEKRKCESYELLLGVRTEFEHALMDALYPKDFPTTQSQYFKCLFVTHMQIGPMADTYRRIIRESGFSLDEFCFLADTEIYDAKSKIVHKVQIPSHCLTIENYKAIIQDDEELMAFIRDGHRREDIISTILKLRQARLTQTGPLGTSAFPENSNRCILISNVPLKKESRPRYIPKSQIQSVFKVKEAKNNILSICETKESYVEGMIAGKVLVEFAKPVHTAWALLEHQKTVLEHDISVKLVNCDDWDCANDNKWSSGTNSHQ